MRPRSTASWIRSKAPPPGLTAMPNISSPSRRWLPQRPARVGTLGHRSIQPENRIASWPLHLNDSSAETVRAAAQLLLLLTAAFPFDHQRPNVGLLPLV